MAASRDPLARFVAWALNRTPAVEAAALRPSAESVSTETSGSGSDGAAVGDAPKEGGDLLLRAHALERAEHVPTPVCEEDFVGDIRSSSGPGSDGCQSNTPYNGGPRSRVCGPGDTAEKVANKLRQLVLKKDSDATMALGVFVISIGGVEYEVDLRKCGDSLQVGHGMGLNLINIYYNEFFKESSPRICISSIEAPTPGNKVHAVRPPPFTGALRVLVPIAIQLCAYFFGETPVCLIDDARRPGYPQLSTVKLLTGRSAYSAYGLFGFYLKHVDQLRINKASQFYATYSLVDMIDLMYVRKDKETIDFFDFTNATGHVSTDEEFTERVAGLKATVERLEGHLFEITKRHQEFTAQDLTVPITNLCNKLLDTYSRVGEEIIMDAYQCIVKMVANFQWSLLNYLDRARWAEYAALAQVGPAAFAPRPAKD